MSDKNIYLRIGINTGVQIIGKIITFLTSFLSVAMLTRYLGQNGYGNYSLVFAYLSFFTILSDWGFQFIIVRELSTETIDRNLLLGTYLRIKILLVFLSTAVALLCLFLFPYSRDLKIGIIIGAVAVGVSNINSLSSAIFQSKLRLDLVALIDTVGRITAVAGLAFFIFLKLNFFFILGSVLVGNAASLIVALALIKPNRSWLFRFNREIAIKLITWSIPLGFTSLLAALYFKIDTILLSLMRTSAEVGIYSLAYGILENIILLWALYTASIFPLLSKYYASQDQRSLNLLIRRSIYIGGFVSMMVIGIGYPLTPLVVSILGGRNFVLSILPARILLFSVPLIFIDYILYNVLLCRRQVLSILIATAVALIGNLCLNLYAIPKWGYVGASVTTVMTEAILFACYLTFVLNRQRFAIENTKVRV